MTHLLHAALLTSVASAATLASLPQDARCWFFSARSSVLLAARTERAAVSAVSSLPISAVSRLPPPLLLLLPFDSQQSHLPNYYIRSGPCMQDALP